MNKLILTTAALALVAGAATAGSHETVVRMGTEGAYPPWNLINDNGEVDGFERELGDELCARAELTCEWVTNDWDSIIPNLVSGNYDVIIAGMSITDERDEDTVDELWLVEHPPVFTQGQAGKSEHVLAPGDIPVVQTDRGWMAMRAAPSEHKDADTSSPPRQRPPAQEPGQCTLPI